MIQSKLNFHPESAALPLGKKHFHFISAEFPVSAGWVVQIVLLYKPKFSRRPPSSAVTHDLTLLTLIMFCLFGESQ